MMGSMGIVGLRQHERETTYHLLALTSKCLPDIQSSHCVLHVVVDVTHTFPPTGLFQCCPIKCLEQRCNGINSVYASSPQPHPKQLQGKRTNQREGPSHFSFVSLEALVFLPLIRCAQDTIRQWYGYSSICPTTLSFHVLSIRLSICLSA